MRPIHHIVLGIFIVLSHTGYATPFLQEAIDSYLTEHQFQGVALVAQGGKIVFEQGYGHANEDYQLPNTPQTTFRIASITKQFTAAAILLLQEKNQLNVFDPIAKYIPDYPQGDLITLHHLLCHTSGVANITALPNLSDIQRLPSTPTQSIAYFKDLPLSFTPGTECEYSDSNYILLGAIIEIITQQTCGDYMKENIFQPLGINSTYFETPRAVIPFRASGYHKDTTGQITPAPYIDMSFPHAAGAIVSSVEDLYQWDRALKSGSLLSPSSLQSLFTTQASNKERKIAYGYGFRIGPLNSGFEECEASIIGHLGTIEGFKCAAIDI